MFKYIWIIMIVLVLAAFGAYTVYCCIQEAKDAASLEEWFDNMDMDHQGLLIVWCVIFIAAAVILFASSFAAFCYSFE